MKYERDKLASEVKLWHKDGLLTERRFYLRVDLLHVGHPPHAFKGACNRVSRGLARQVRKMTRKGVKSAPVLRAAMKAADVGDDNVCDVPTMPFDTKWTPSSKSLYNLMTRAKADVSIRVCDF